MHIDKIRKAKSLRALLAAIEAEEADRFQSGAAMSPELKQLMAKLPTFGGDPPANRERVLSWDEKSLLIDGCEEGRIVPR